MFNRILLSMGGMLLETATDDITGVTNEVLQAVINYINWIFSGILGVAAAVAMIYAIVVGVRMARANNAEEREEAKKKVIYTVIGIAVAIALIILIQILLPKITEWTGYKPAKPETDGGGFIGLLKMGL